VQFDKQHDGVPLSRIACHYQRWGRRRVWRNKGVPPSHGFAAHSYFSKAPPTVRNPRSVAKKQRAKKGTYRPWTVAEAAAWPLRRNTLWS